MDSSSKVLIVEDSVTQGLALQALLNRKGFQSEIAYDGIEALEKLNSFSFFVVISDIVMPRMNGYELCKSIKSSTEFRELPVILITILQDPFDLIRGIECGADYFLTKPYDEELLFKRIQEVIENQKLKKNGSSDWWYNGEKIHFSSQPLQLMDLLMSSYENALDKNQQLLQANEDLLQTNLKAHEKNIELKAYDEEKNHLVGVIVHDIRTPLNQLLNFSEFLLSYPFQIWSEDIKKMVWEMKKSSLQISAIINHLTELTRLETKDQALALNLKKQNLGDLILKQLGLKDLFLSRKNLSIKFKEEKELPEIPVDNLYFEQIFDHLFFNLVNRANPGDKLQILLDRESSFLVLTMTNETHKTEGRIKLFEKTQSTVGMIITKKIIAAHKGSLNIEQSDEKDQITLKLPLSKP